MRLRESATRPAVFFIECRQREVHIACHRCVPDTALERHDRCKLRVLVRGALYNFRSPERPLPWFRFHNAGARFRHPIPCFTRALFVSASSAGFGLRGGCHAGAEAPALRRTEKPYSDRRPPGWIRSRNTRDCPVATAVGLTAAYGKDEGTSEEESARAAAPRGVTRMRPSVRKTTQRAKADAAKGRTHSRHEKARHEQRRGHYRRRRRVRGRARGLLEHGPRVAAYTRFRGRARAAPGAAARKLTVRRLVTTYTPMPVLQVTDGMRVEEEPRLRDSAERADGARRTATSI